MQPIIDVSSSLVKVRTANSSLVTDQNQTITTADSTAGSSTLTVKNITGFAINQILIIGQIGNQGTEIIKTHGSTAPSGSTITLASNTLYPHSASTIVTFSLYDQVEISTAATITGSKSVLTTVTLFGDQEETTYNDTANSTGYYFARFKNSISNSFSGYSDPLPSPRGYPMNSARSIIDSALGMINKSTSYIFSDDFAFGEIDNGQMECIKDLKRWSFMQQFDYSLGDLTTGQWRVALPVDCDDQNSNKSIYNFRIGKGSNLVWVDKEKWNDLIQDIAYSTLANNIVVNATSIVLTDSSDFNSTGAITIGANSYTYTANNISTNTLTIAASTTTNTAGEYAFQGESKGTPTYWTTYGGYLYFYPLLSSTLNGKNGKLDYYSKLIQTYSDSTLTILPDPTVLQYYVAWKFLLRQENGKENDETLAMKNNYLARKKVMITKETANRTFQLRPRLNKFNMGSSDSKSIRLGNFTT